MYPKLKVRKNKFKIRVANYMCSIKNVFLGVFDGISDFSYLIVLLKKNFHF